MSRRQANPLLWHQIEKRIVWRRQMLMHRLHDLVAGMRTGYRQQGRELCPDHVGARAETAGNDDATVFL